jgi:FtsH-binding integral membrane protein
MDKVNIVAIMIAITLYSLMNSLNKRLTVQTYVQNTYTYIVLGLLLLSLALILMPKTNGISMGKIFAVFILTIVVIFGINYTENNMLRHILWVLFIVGMAYIMQPLYNTMDRDALWKVIITVALIAISLTYYASTVGINRFDSWGNYLFYGLLALIIFECLDILFSKSYSINRNKIYSWFAIVLFSGFLLYDTKKVEQHGRILSQLCNNNSVLCRKYLNYPSESLSIFLDIINLFSNTANLQN